MKRLIPTILAFTFGLPAWAGYSFPSLNIPETHIPTTDSVVRNPVTLEAAQFTDPVQTSGTYEVIEYQWFVGQWDAILPNQEKQIRELPFTFTLHGNDYDKIGITKLGYVSLLPSDADNFNDFTEVAKDFEMPSSSTFQLAQHPTIFALAQNGQYHISWSIYPLTSSDISDNQTDAVLVKESQDEVTVYSKISLRRSGAEQQSTQYPLTQVITLHKNGNIELHYATDFPVTEMMVDTNTYEASHSANGLRLYSGIIIPRSITGDVPLPLLNNIESSGNKSFLFNASTLDSLTGESFPGDGSNVTAAAPTILADTTIDSLELPSMYFTATESNTLTTNLIADTQYSWGVRHSVSHTGSGGSGSGVSDWSELDQFTVEANPEDDDDELLGTFNPLLFVLMSLVLFIRKQK